jgi:hypothetical protein
MSRAPIALALALALFAGIGCDAKDAESLDCTAQGEFVVELRLATDEEPELFHGSQGGTHVILAARLSTPDPHDRYEVALLAEAGEEPCVDLECAAWSRIGGYATQIDETNEQVGVVGPGEVELVNLFLVVDRWDAAPRRRITLEVDDACGRHALTRRTFD